MSISDLMSTVPPPDDPEWPGEASDWTALRETTDIVVPRDYRALVSTYGAGTFSNFLSVLNPFLVAEGYSYTQHINEILDAYQVLMRLAPQRCPYGVYGGCDGLYPWLMSENGDVGYWLVSGDTPEEWPTVLFDSRHSEHEKHELTCTALVLRWVRGELASRFLQVPLSRTFVKASGV